MSEAQMVLDIVTAYEEGYNAATLNLSSIENRYIINTPKYYAWMFGHSTAAKELLINSQEFIEN